MVNIKPTHLKLESFLESLSDFHDRITFQTESNGTYIFNYYEADSNTTKLIICLPTPKGFNIHQAPVSDPNYINFMYHASFDEIEEAN